MYSYRKSIKSKQSDELINTYLLRPIAGLIVWLLYYTPVTPNQVTTASIIAGLIAALFYLKGTSNALVIAGVFIVLKDILDSADGQLARAKQQYSRVGRFLDSIGDFVVNVAVFGSIGWTLFQSNGAWSMLILSGLCLIGISLRVSYHVFYQVSFLHLQHQYTNNRITEEVQEEDLKKGGLELILQRVFQLIYGWQDSLMGRLDAWSRRGRADTNFLLQWYSDAKGLRISGLLGFGTELSILILCSIVNQLESYLYLNLFFMNGILIFSMFYRRIILSHVLLSKTIR
jgi:phosphatidylglycerophosphate synthase